MVIATTIKIWYGIWDSSKETTYDKVGFFNDESRRYLPIPNKFRRLLAKKSVKFQKKSIEFILGRDSNKHIEAIAICHPSLDKWDEKIGEDVVVGRIKRMRGDLKKTIYEKEDYTKLILVWRNKKTEEEKWKSMVFRRTKTDENGFPIIIRELYHIPYNIHERYRIKQKDGTFIAGELKYPYIYKMDEEL